MISARTIDARYTMPRDISRNTMHESYCMSKSIFAGAALCTCAKARAMIGASRMTRT